MRVCEKDCAGVGLKKIPFVPDYNSWYKRYFRFMEHNSPYIFICLSFSILIEMLQ